MPVTPEDLFAFLKPQGITSATVDQPPLLTVENASLDLKTIHHPSARTARSPSDQRRFYLKCWVLSLAP